MGTYNVYNVTKSNDSSNTDHFYYDVDSGFLMKAHTPEIGDLMELESNVVISEFPIIFPVLLAVFPIVLKLAKFSKK